MIADIQAGLGEQPEGQLHPSGLVDEDLCGFPYHSPILA